MKPIIEQFYQAFQELDAEKMVACYHDDIVFQDPAFGVLKGERAKDMWRMLCQSQKGKDFQVKASNIHFDGKEGYAHWEAHYTFSQTGRKIHNIIEAEFEFRDGKIIRHTDRFNLHRWAQQALGPVGYIMGWTPFFRKKLQEQTKKLLDGFIRNHGR
jgi:ketosteroid isomerase-like protein